MINWSVWRMHPLRLYDRTVASQSSSQVYSTHPSDTLFIVITLVWVEILGSNKTRLQQPETKRMWGFVFSLPEWSGDHILLTNQLFYTDQRKIKNSSISMGNSNKCNCWKVMPFILGLTSSALPRGRKQMLSYAFGSRLKKPSFFLSSRQKLQVSDQVKYYTFDQHTCVTHGSVSDICIFSRSAMQKVWLKICMCRSHHTNVKNNMEQ